MKTLVVYWSWTNGNTERIAKNIAAYFNADIEKLQPEHEYEGSYNDVVAEGKREADHHTGRPIKPLKHDLSEYERIIVGTPTWWYTMSPVVYTFLKENDFSGKTVTPFMTNAGWPGHVIKDMTKMLKGADVVNPKEIRFASDGGSDMETSADELEDWIQSL